jgi:hypothetical protein
MHGGWGMPAGMEDRRSGAEVRPPAPPARALCGRSAHSVPAEQSRRAERIKISDALRALIRPGMRPANSDACPRPTATGLTPPRSATRWAAAATAGGGGAALRRRRCRCAHYETAQAGCHAQSPYQKQADAR